MTYEEAAELADIITKKFYPCDNCEGECEGIEKVECEDFYKWRTSYKTALAILERAAIELEKRSIKKDE
jgi:hypothetical protein